MPLDRQHIIFGCVFFLLVAAIVYRVMNPFVQPRVTTLTFTGKTQADRAMVSKSIPGDGQNKTHPVISQFVNRAKRSGQVHQDLFVKFQPPRPASDGAAGTGDAAVETAGPPPAPAAEQDPVAKFRKYITSYKIYGSYEGEDGKAVFLSKDKLVLVAKEGDRLDGKYVIDDIGDAHIRFFLPDLDRPVTVDRGEFDDE